MDESGDKKEPEAAKINGTEQPKRRNIRRKLVQSTLFPHKSAEIEPKEGEDDNKEGEDKDFCGSQEKKVGRKRKAKGTPQKPASKKAKGKSPMKATPKKNGMNNLMESEDVSPPLIPNLRLEAKLTAEENSRMFAGRQVHPFFASCKAGKRSQETVEVGNGSLINRSNKHASIGPIHVFEKTQDDVVLDWKNWTFFEETPVNSSCNNEGLFTSVFENCIEALDLDNFNIASHLFDTSFVENNLSDQCVIQDNEVLGTSSEISAVLVDELQENYQLSSEVDRQDEVSVLFKQADNVEKLELEQQSRFCQERFVQCYHPNSLWIDKYQPKKASEVCGNAEAVKFMSEWLHLWHERSFQQNKASNNIDKGNIQEEDDDFCGSDFDSESIDGEDSLKKVLLVTGPIGSGKSAAIRACAKEQGFKVLESNASDCRNGAVVKQKFAGALESLCLTGSLENPVGSLDRHVMQSAGSLSNDKAAQEFDNEVIELIPISDEEDLFDARGASLKLVCNDTEAGFTQSKVKPLILFEDIDVIFPEDRGFVAAIQQIASKAKGPVILTSNGNELVLPKNLDRLELCFTKPSSEELLRHLHMVCAAEESTVQPHLLEQLIKFCQGDIRKTIMHLQFWCQSKNYQKDRKLQRTCGLLLLDIEANHSVLPTLIPWNFPSHLSEFVEKEIAKTLSMMEENSALMEVEEELKNNCLHYDLPTHNNEIGSIGRKKEVMLNRNPSVQDCSEFINPYTAQEFYNSPGTPVSFSCRTRRKKLDVVMSSDSEDELIKQPSLFLDKNVNCKLFSEDGRLLSHCPNVQNCFSPLTDEQIYCEAEEFEDKGFSCADTENNLPTETRKSMDVSYVPETEMVNGMELSSRTVSYVNVAETTEVSVSCQSKEDLPVEMKDPGRSIYQSVRTSDVIVSTHNTTAEASHEEVVENSQNEYDDAVSRGHALMDECSRIDFNKMSLLKAKLKKQVAIDLVQESWKKLRDSRADLNHYVDSVQKDALKIIELTSSTIDLISQADELLSKCHMQDSLELLGINSENSYAFSWGAEQLQMIDTVSQHGFCLYAKDIDALGSKMGFEQRVDLSQEMLACSTSTMALGRLFGQDAGASRSSVNGKGLDMSPLKHKPEAERDVKTCLLNIVESLVPSRSYLALKGTALLEYISSLGCISRSEASRISEGRKLAKRRRARGSLHYLSTGPLNLSAEDISLLDECNLNGRLPSNNRC